MERKVETGWKAAGIIDALKLGKKQLPSFEAFKGASLVLKQFLATKRPLKIIKIIFISP